MERLFFVFYRGEMRGRGGAEMQGKTTKVQVCFANEEKTTKVWVQVSKYRIAIQTFVV